MIIHDSHPKYNCLHNICVNTVYIYYIYINTNTCMYICDPGPQTNLKSLGFICSNSQKYIWVKIIDFSFMPKIIRILSSDHVP